MADPFVQTPDSVDFSQFMDQSSPDTGMPLDASGAPLSGDTYSPAQPGGGTNLPFVPSGQSQQLRPNEDKFPGFYSAPAQQQANQLRPNEDKFPGFYGPAAKQLPQGIPPTKPGHPAPQYGNDIFGQALQAETQIPGGEGVQAAIHGAQSQALPGIAGIGAAVGVGALAGSVVPGIGTAGGAIVGLIAGLGGYWLGSQAQDAATKALVPEQTRQAYAAQVKYEQQTQPLWYGVGELAPQFAAFKPNPKAIMGAFKLAGSINAAPMAEKWAAFSGPKLGSSIAEQLDFREHQDAVNQLLMMGFGSAYTAYQAKQQVDAGQVQPLILAANLIGSTLLSKPRWIKDVAPELRPGVEQSSQKGAGSYVAGAQEQNPEYAKAWQDNNDAIQSGDQARIAETQARLDAETVARRAPQEQPTEQQPAAQAGAMPRTPDVIGQELIDTINSARTPEEKLKLAQEADAIAERQRIPNWESQVARLKTEDQSQLQAQTQTIKGLAENPAFTRQSAPSQFDQKAFAQAAAKLHETNPETRTWTDDELRASIIASQANTAEASKKMIEPLRGQEPASTEQTPTPASEHAQAVMRTLREGEPATSEETASPELSAMRGKNLLDERSNAEAILRIGDNLTRDQSDALAHRVGIVSAGKPDEVLRNELKVWAEKHADPTSDQVNVPAIKNLLSEARTTIGGETRAVSEMSPSLINTLGKGMYSGDVVEGAVKESLQNSADSLRGDTGSQPKQIHITIDNEGFTISDSGAGMLPEVATSELVDIGGSTKVAGESGGWGLAKVRLFSNAQDIQIRTTAKRPNGTLAETELSGSGLDWADKNIGLKVTTMELPAGTQTTGTTMTIKWNPDVKSDPYYAAQHMQQTIKNLNMPENVRISVSSPLGNINTDQITPFNDRFSKLGQFHEDGAKIDVFSSPDYVKSDYGDLHVSILNNGLFQFKMSMQAAKGIEMPRDLIMDVHATGSPKEDNYPWETNRQSLRPQFREYVEKYIKETLVADAAKKMANQIKAALQQAPKLVGSKFRVVDLSGKMNPEIVNAIADSAPLHGFTQQASRALGSFKGGTDVGPEFMGISLSREHLGVNIHASAGGPTRTRNMVLINPFVALDEVSRGLGINMAQSAVDHAQVVLPDGSMGWADRQHSENSSNYTYTGDGGYSYQYTGPTVPAPEGPYRTDFTDAQWSQLAQGLAYRTAATLIHEYSHETSRGHEEPFSGALTRDFATHLDNIHSYAKRMTRYLTDNNYDGIKEIERLNREHDLSRTMGANEVFRNISTGLAAEGQQPGLHQGNIETGAEGGARPIQPLRESGVREAGPLVPSTGMGRSEPEYKVTRAKDFADSGEYDVSIAGNNYKIYRDPSSRMWHEAGTNQHYSQTYLGNSREEAITRLIERTQEGEQNGIQQTPTSIGQETGQISRPNEASEIGQPGQVGVEANPTGVSPNPTEALNASGSSEGGNGNAEAGAHGTPTARTGIIRPDAGNESGPVGATDATGANAATGNESGNATSTNAATAARLAEATNNPTGNRPSVERGATYGEQPASGATEPGAINRGLNTSAADPTVVKATADSLRAHLKQPGYIATPEEKTLLSVLDNKVQELNQIGNPKPWPTLDPRLPEATDKNLLNRTFKAVDQTKPIEGEGGRAYADRVVKATGLYKNLDHTLEIVRGARDGFVELAQTPDGKVGFKVDGKFYKGTPSTHVANWDNAFRGVVHSILDGIPNEVLATEPKDQSPLPMDIQQVRSSFADQFRPASKPLMPFAEERVEPPSMSAHDFVMSAHAADTRASELNSSSAVNRVKAGLTQVQEHIDLVDELAANGFDPEVVQKKFGELEQEAGGGSGLPPRPPTGGGGDEPPQSGKTPEERKADLLKAQIAQTQKLEDAYQDAFKQGRLTENPLQERIHNGIHDILSNAMKTFDTSLWEKHPRVWAKEASNTAKAFAMYYKKVNEDIKSRMGELETQSPGAEDRIRAVFTAGDDTRPSLLEQMSPDERGLANHLHTYWQLLGDILTRSGVIKSALQDYFPLIAEKPRGDKMIGPNGQRLSAKTTHSISRLLDKEDGSLLFKTPEELQAWADDKGLGWKVKTDIGDVYEAQGASVIKALVMKHTVDQMMNNEFILNKYGESAPAILNQKMMDNHIVALDNSDQFVKSDKIIGPWQSALTRPKWVGNQRVPEDLWVRKDLAEQMSREASFAEMGDNPTMRLMRWLSNVNNYWKTFKFALTPMHAYSMLGNVSAHAGFAGTYGVVRRGADITNNPEMRSRFFQLLKASGSTEPIGEGLDAKGGPHSVLNNLPGIGNIFKAQEHVMWKTIGYNSLYGLGDKLSSDYMAMMAVKHPDVQVTQFDADKFGMDSAKKAVGYLDQLDMSKNYQLGANVLLLANRWTTGQVRTLGEAFSIKRLANIGNPVPMEGSSARASELMQRRQIEMSRRLVMGGMLRLFLVGTAMSTVFSALHNNGVPSTPWDNFQKDPAHTFDIYTGRDPVTNRDTWTHMPFYLFQREMVDWAMAAVKAQEQGKEFIDPKNFGDSVLTAPFVRFAGKMNPVTKTSLEVATGQEIGQWMKGYDKAGIDSDQYIQNINKSLQKMNIPDQGSLENRLLYAMKNLLPGINYPQNLPGATSDPWAVASAIAGLPVGGNETNVGLGFLGTRIDQGQTYTIGANGQEVPTWQNKQMQDQKTATGQQILAIASTLGTGTADEETQKFSQIEGLRQQGGFSPGQLVQLVEFGAGHNTGGQGLLYQNLPPKTPDQMKPAATVINGYKLSPQQEVTYEGIKFQHEAFSIGQIMNDPSWKNMSAGDRSAAMNSAKQFVDRITNEQFSIAVGATKGNTVSTTQANQMIVSYGKLSKYAQADLQRSPLFSSATPDDQKLMLADRVKASETAVWDKNFGTGILKNASDSQMLNYVQVHSGVRDEVRQLVNQLPSYTQAQNPVAKVAMLNSSLKFADTLINQAASGTTLKTFDSPLARQQISLAVKNGIILQDAALKELHQSFIYQEASNVDQPLLDQKYTNLAHNIALYDMRQGITSQPASSQGFDAALRTTLAADEGYQSLVEQYFGIGGLQALKAKDKELSDLKMRFRQENAIRPADLAHYDTMINRWYDQQNQDYAQFRHARTFWEANDPVGQAYHAVSQSNLGFEAIDPLALATG